MSARQVFAPGKLVLCGEYAVLLPGGEGLVLAVSSGIVGSWQAASTHRVQTELLPGETHSLDFVNGRFEVAQESARAALSFVVAALNHVAACRGGEGAPPGFLLQLHTVGALEVETASGPAKLGLGSSAAAVTATVKLALEGWNIPASQEDGLHLALRAHADAQGGRGSGVDVAASYLGGLVRVRKTEAGLEARRLADDLPLPWLAVWTGASAKTVPRVAQFQRWCQQAPVEAQAWLLASTHETHRVLSGLEHSDPAEVLEAFRAHRRLLRTLGHMTGLEQETPALERLGELGERFGAAKQSGAGGGDCGLVILSAVQRLPALRMALAEASLTALPLTSAS